MNCDEWNCPYLGERAAIEGKQEPLGKEFERVLHDNLWELYVRSDGMPEEERDPEPPDEDDDEIAVDWDENAQWPEENEEVEEEE